MAVTTKMSVDVSGFKAGIQQAQNSVRTLDAELKRNEAQFKATGDKEKYMEAQTKALNSRITEQQKVVKNAENALKAMEQSGIKPTDAAYQQMQRTLLNAQTAIAQTTVQMDALDASEQKAASSATKMTDSLASIGKKVNLDAVISGVDSITKSLENAAKAAVSFATEAWGEIMEMAGYADDIATKATIYGLTPTEYQAMANLAATWSETSVEDIMTARRRMWKNGRSFAEEGVFAEMGINPYAGGKYNNVMKDWEDLFWESGTALMQMEPFMRAEYGEKLFGRTWERLIPMFEMGRTEYESRLGTAMESVISDDDVQTLAKLNDTVGELEGKLTALEGTIVAKLAPALTAAAEAFSGLLDELLAYLKTPEGQEMLDRLGQAVTGLFEDLAKIDPKDVVANLTSVFTALTDGLKWLWEHKDDVVNALKWIIDGWALLKISGGALDVLRLITGLKGFSLNGALTGAGAGAAGARVAGTATNAVTTAVTASAGSIATGIATALTSTLGVGILTAIMAPPVIAGVSNFVGKYGSLTPDSSQFMATEVAAAGGDPDVWNRFSSMNLGGGKRQSVQVLAGMVVDDDAAEEISEQIGVVPVAVNPIIAWDARYWSSGGVGGSGRDTDVRMHANGLPWVPNDGYLAMLHRGERVMTATENRHYTYNSNNYFGNVNLNNGMEIDALCDSIDRHNRRQNAGFGA